MTGRSISYKDVSAAWNGPAYAISYVTRSAPAAGGAYTFMQTDFDASGNMIRTYDLASGRIDCYGTGPGAAFVLASSAAAVDGNNLGHYAYRGKDSNGNYNTYCYVLGTAKTVAAAGLYSSISISCMQNVAAGAGNAQPNWGILIDGSTSQVTMPSGATIAASGNFSDQAATGPTFTFTNTANSRNLVVGVSDNFNGVVNATGGGNLNLQSGSVTGISLSSIVVDIPIATKLRVEQRTSKTGNYTVVAADGGTQFDNNAASGEVDFTLPAAPSSGTRYGFTVIAAQTVKVIAPASTTINVGGAVSSAAGDIASAQVGAYIELEYVGSNKWHAKMVTGTGGTAGAGGWTVT